MSNEVEFYTIEQLSEMLQVNYQLVYNMVRKGEIPSVRIGKLYRVMASDFKDYLLKNRTMSTDGADAIICSSCGKSFMSKLSITTKCLDCGSPICKTCAELKKTKYCEIHKK